MLCLKYVTGHRSDQAVKSYNDRPSIEQQKKMSHVLSKFVSAGASKASPCTGISAAAKENECHGQQERQPQSEGTVLVQNEFSGKYRSSAKRAKKLSGRFYSTAMSKFTTITEAENQENLP